MPMDLITVKFDNGESVTMNHIEVMWFGRDGGIVGHAGLEEFRDFCQEKLADARFDAKVEHGMDAESA
jgi:hypothetical protein